MEQPATTKWHNEIRSGGLRLRSQFDDFAPTGIPDPALTATFLARRSQSPERNGFSVTGQAIFQFRRHIYPTQFAAVTNRDFVYAQRNYRVTPHIVALGGFKYEAERGSTPIQRLPCKQHSAGATIATHCKSPETSGIVSIQRWQRHRRQRSVRLAGERRGFGCLLPCSTPSRVRLVDRDQLHASFSKALKSRTSFNRGSLFDIFQQFRAATN